MLFNVLIHIPLPFQSSFIRHREGQIAGIYYVLTSIVFRLKVFMFISWVDSVKGQRCLGHVRVVR